METLDKGHHYLAECYDGEMIQPIQFMKREGPGYPMNVGHHPGTNCQELIRILIDRVDYLDCQIPHDNNAAVIKNLRNALWLLEDRAAERHGFAGHDFDFRPDGIEDEPTCKVCGHILCKGHETGSR